MFGLYKLHSLDQTIDSLINKVKIKCIYLKYVKYFKTEKLFLLFYKIENYILTVTYIADSVDTYVYNIFECYII